MTPASSNVGAGEVWFVLPWEPHFPGGVNGVVKSLMRAWPAGHRLQPRLVVDDWEAGHLVERSDASRIRIGTLATTSGGRLLRSALLSPIRALHLLRALRECKVVALNFHYAGTSPVTAVALKKAGLFRGKIIVSFHGSDVNRVGPAWEHRVRCWSYANCDALVACAEHLAERAAAVFGLDRACISVVRNGVDSQVFGTVPGEAPTDLPARYIASVGGYVALKNHALTIRAFSRVAARERDLHLCIAGGSGPTLDDLRALVASLGMEGRVHFYVGLSQAQVAGLLQSASLLVQSSTSEAMPLAVLEAGAQGLPVVLSRIPGHAELVSDGRDGTLFESENEVSCADAIDKVLSDQPGAQCQARQFQSFVRANLTWSSAVSGYIGIIEQ